MNDTQRIDWIESIRPRFWLDTSSGQTRWSLDGGETWHDSLRDAIDTAMENDTS